jgi:20S proteasome alpha/beta subunit
MELFEQKYKPGLNADDAILLALEGLRQSLEENATLAQVEVCVVQEGKPFRRLLPEEIQKYAARLPPASSGSGGGRGGGGGRS